MFQSACAGMQREDVERLHSCAALQYWFLNHPCTDVQTLTI